MLQKMKIRGRKKLQMMNTCLTLQSCNRISAICVRKESVKESCPGKRIIRFSKKTAAELEILSEVLVVNANQWLIMQEAFAAWIKMKFLKIILKVYFPSFLKHFYSVIC